MKLNLIQRSENSKGEWYLRVRLNGREHKINLETTSKRDANKLAEAKYEELARAANIDGAFNSLVDLLDRLPHEESKKKRAELRAQLNVTRLNDLPSMSELWQLWSDLPSSKRRASHIDDISRWERWTRFLKQNGYGDACFNQIDESTATAFAVHLDKQELTRHSKLRIIALLRNVFARFGDEYGMATNPFVTAADKLSNQHVDSTDGLPDKRGPFSPEELSAITSTLDPRVIEPNILLPPIIRKHRREYFALVLIMLGTGLRLKDAIYLQKKQIKGSVLEMSPFKTRWRGVKIVKVPIPDWVKTVIKDYCTPDEEGRLMPGLKAEYDASRQEVSKSLNVLLKRLGIKTTGKPVEGRARAVAIKGWHSFRHTYDSLMQQVVANPVLVQKAMGHASLSQTFDYTHANMGELANAAETLNPLEGLTAEENKDASAQN
tara:strand:- start:577 stop:1881 length:1305 start_codon:yes stop_codon:yes gene_type:complete